jgi:hypothetical protein
MTRSAPVIQPRLRVHTGREEAQVSGPWTGPSFPYLHRSPGLSSSGAKVEHRALRRPIKALRLVPALTGRG